MGRIVVSARVENLGDLIAVDEGRLPAGDVRAVNVPDALVDTGATGLSMPRSMLALLGSKYLKNRRAVTSAGPIEVRTFGTARLNVQGRDCPVDVTELPDGCPMLIGQIPLEAMDFVIDMRTHQLTGNPDHGGEHVIEMY